MKIHKVITITIGLVSASATLNNMAEAKYKLHLQSKTSMNMKKHSPKRMSAVASGIEISVYYYMGLTGEDSSQTVNLPGAEVLVRRAGDNKILMRSHTNSRSVLKVNLPAGSYVLVPSPIPARRLSSKPLQIKVEAGKFTRGIIEYYYGQ